MMTQELATGKDTAAMMTLQIAAMRAELTCLKVHIMHADCRMLYWVPALPCMSRLHACT